MVDRDVTLDTLVILVTMMNGAGIQKIELDSSGRLLYTSYLSGKEDNIMPETESEEPEGPQFDPFQDPEEIDEPKDYDDPDMWPDGERPTFESA